ncbi:MAG: ATP-binding protein [Anaerolineaceae bacterium]
MVRRDLALRGALLGATVALAGLLADAAARPDGAGSRFLLTLAVVFSGGALGWFALLRPTLAVRNVSRAAGRVAEGELDQQVSGGGGPVSDLTHSFNVMARRVQALFDSVAAERARLEAVFDASTDGMVALARDTNVRFLNPAAAQIFDVDMSQTIGRPLIETARDYELDALVRRAIAAASAETSVITFGPKRTPLRAGAVPISEGGDWAVLLMLTDLTDVERINQIRRDFLSNVSHELRTPLAAIRALVETIQDDAVNEPGETAEFMRRIHQQVQRITTLVNELLDLSRIESGAVQLAPEKIDLSQLMQEAASLLQTRTDASGVRILAPQTLGVEVEADRSSLLRVAGNLLDNAIKYSPPGGTIHVKLHDEGELAALSVQDEGPGIPESDLPRVFERFYKGEASRSNSGTGLGLAIVKHIVRSHGGTVSVTNAGEGGAVFTVRLPKVFVGSRPPLSR